MATAKSKLRNIQDLTKVRRALIQDLVERLGPMLVNGQKLNSSVAIFDQNGAWHDYIVAVQWKDGVVYAVLQNGTDEKLLDQPEDAIVDILNQITPKFPDA